MTQADFLRAIAEARAEMQALAKLYPGCFHPDGRPIEAVLCLPQYMPEAKRTPAQGE